MMSRRALRLALAASAAPAIAVAATNEDAGIPVGEIELVAEPAPFVEVEPVVVAEPIVEIVVETTPVGETEPEIIVETEPVVDAFAQASGVFGFRPVVEDEPAASVPATDQPLLVGATPESVHVAPRRHRVAKRFVAAGASLGVMAVAGFMAVSMTLPASAVAAAQGGTASVASLVAADGKKSSAKVPDGEIQAFVASSGVKDEVLARSDDYSTVSLIDVAAEENIRFSDSLYTNDPEAAIQWPFMVGVAMSSPYGMRNGRMHAGIDLVPGNGATIQAIADGTVRIATESGGAYGVTAYVDHIIDGKVVTSHYAHMQHGSLAVRAGQKVKVGDTIGKVGNTGRSYGAHLHFEIIINGSTVNPLDWMRKNAGRSSY